MHEHAHDHDDARTDATPRTAHADAAPGPAPGTGPAPAPAHPCVPASSPPAAPPSDPPLRPLRAVQHAFLHVPTLAHLDEHRELAGVLATLAEESLAADAPFPSTVISGPEDTSKRVIAQAIAAEMAVPASQLDLSTIRTPQELHESLARLERGEVLVVTAPEHAQPGPLVDLASAFRTRRHVLRSIPGTCYEPFSVVLLTRLAIDQTGRTCATFDQRFFVQRTPHTEAVRLRRVFARVGLRWTEHALVALACHAVRLRMRTLSVARFVATALAQRGARTLDDATFDESMRVSLQVLADPKWVRRVERREAKAMARACAPTAASAAAPATGPGSPPRDAATGDAPRLPRASEDGGLANAA